MNAETADKVSEMLDAFMDAMNSGNDNAFVMISRFFDIKSEKNLDKKIKVLKEIADGKTISEIDGFYDILEKMPKEVEWD